MRKNKPALSLSLFLELIKFKLSMAVTLSSVTGYFLFRNDIKWEIFCLAAGVFFLASGASILNQITERELDLLMERTKNRPLPLKRISLNSALFMCISLFLCGSALLLATGIIPCALGLLNLIIYNYLYTRLKKISFLAVIPGALVGAIPPLIGFASAGGKIPDHDIIVFSLFMFFWQIPHFWLILIKYGKEYAAAGFPSLLNYIDEKKILSLIFLWVIFTSGFLILSGIESFSGVVKYPLILLNVTFIFLFYRSLFVNKLQQNAFILINSFSFLLMFFLIAVSVLGMK